MGDSIAEHYRGSLREIIGAYIIANMIGTQSPKYSTAAVRATRVFEVGTNVSIYKPISGSSHFIFHCSHITPLGSPWGLQPLDGFWGVLSSWLADLREGRHIYEMSV